MTGTGKIGPSLPKNVWLILFGVLFLGHIPNLFLDVMETDAAQYATISRQMVETGSYLEVYIAHNDYLDKPPLLFWLSALSMHIFGFTNFAYKLPSFLVLILGVYSTFRFARLWHGQEIARFAAFMLSSCTAFFLMTNDVKTDGMLLGWIMLCVWQFSEYLHFRRLGNLLLGGLGLGAAMLTKGPIGAIIPALALGGHLVLRREWRKILDPAWLLVIPTALLLLLPMCIGLYNQFDLHPEKEVYGLKGPSGLKFFFWTQSFGRITGESSWTNDTPIWYFLETIAWDFLPWVILLIPAIFAAGKLIKNEGLAGLDKHEWISLSGFVLPFIALSMSGFKLPHYIFPLFPFASVLGAAFFYRSNDHARNIWSRLYFGISHVFVVVGLLILFYLFPLRSWGIPALLLPLVGIAWWVFLKFNIPFIRITAATLPLILFFGLSLSFQFYPSLSPYRSEATFGKRIGSGEYDGEHCLLFRDWGHSIYYYGGYHLPVVTKREIIHATPGTIVLTDSIGRMEIQEELGQPYIIKDTLLDYPVSNLRIEFLNPRTREKVVQHRFVMERVSE